MCEFSEGSIACRGDGFCQDADPDGFALSERALPCPRCNTEAWLRMMKDKAEGKPAYQGDETGTGVDLWEHAVMAAMRENPQVAKQALIGIGRVAAKYLGPDETVMTRDFIYAPLSDDATA